MTGEDLNRRWRSPSATLHPSIYHSKALLEYLTHVVGNADNAGNNAPADDADSKPPADRASLLLASAGVSGDDVSAMPVSACSSATGVSDEVQRRGHDAHLAAPVLDCNSMSLASSSCTPANKSNDELQIPKDGALKASLDRKFEGCADVTKNGVRESGGGAAVAEGDFRESTGNATVAEGDVRESGRNATVAKSGTRESEDGATVAESGTRESRGNATMAESGTRACAGVATVAESGVVVYCDYHGHSRQKNLFLYGCSRRLSWWPQDRCLPDHPRLTVLPALCQDLVSSFSAPHCCYTVERARESTARVAVWRECGVACSYTLEASASGCDQGVYQGYHLGTNQLLEAGAQFCEALHQMLCPAPAVGDHNQLAVETMTHHHARKRCLLIMKPCMVVTLDDVVCVRRSRLALLVARLGELVGRFIDVAGQSSSPNSFAVTSVVESQTSEKTREPLTSHQTVTGDSTPPLPTKRGGGSVKPKCIRARKVSAAKKKGVRSSKVWSSCGEVEALQKHGSFVPMDVGPSCTASHKLARSRKRESDSEAELDRDLYSYIEPDE
ncbi:hypothetical protein HAZT_HAZT004414 [Hyalella azteca]|uniref:Peptidase M14 domain-containing protein n=1 Tax=Hyalella azteca TaxID=294128 RepID=A0A6A0GNY0_HYAAZ|nr:hypothetical protein HAZT_HAZT004414 [Hyalella azteca]